MSSDPDKIHFSDLLSISKNSGIDLCVRKDKSLFIVFGESLWVAPFFSHERAMSGLQHFKYVHRCYINDVCYMCSSPLIYYDFMLYNDQISQERYDSRFVGDIDNNSYVENNKTYRNEKYLKSNTKEDKVLILDHKSVFHVFDVGRRFISSYFKIHDCDRIHAFACNLLIPDELCVILVRNRNKVVELYKIKHNNAILLSTIDRPADSVKPFNNGFILQTKSNLTFFQNGKEPIEIYKAEGGYSINDFKIDKLDIAILLTNGENTRCQMLGGVSFNIKVSKSNCLWDLADGILTFLIKSTLIVTNIHDPSRSISSKINSVIGDGTVRCIFSSDGPYNEYRVAVVDTKIATLSFPPELIENIR